MAGDFSFGTPDSGSSSDSGSDFSSFLKSGAGGASPAIPLGIGLFQSILGGVNQKKSKGLMPSYTDPMESNYLGELDRMRKSFETGSAYASQLRELRNIQSATNKGILSAAGGQTGAALSGIARSGMNTQEAYGKVAAEGEKRMDMYNQLYGEQLNRISQRRAELQLMQYGQAQAKGAEQRKAGLQTLMQLASLAAMAA